MGEIIPTPRQRLRITGTPGHKAAEHTAIPSNALSRRLRTDSQSPAQKGPTEAALRLAPRTPWSTYSRAEGLPWRSRQARRQQSHRTTKQKTRRRSKLSRNEAHQKQPPPAPTLEQSRYCPELRRHNRSRDERRHQGKTKTNLTLELPKGIRGNMYTSQRIRGSPHLRRRPGHRRREGADGIAAGTGSRLSLL